MDSRIRREVEAAFLHTPAWEPFKGEEWGERWEKACTEFWNSAIEAAAKKAEATPVLRFGMAGSTLKVQEVLVESIRTLKGT